MNKSVADCGCLRFLWNEICTNSHTKDDCSTERIGPIRWNFLYFRYSVHMKCQLWSHFNNTTSQKSISRGHWQTFTVICGFFFNNAVTVSLIIQYNRIWMLINLYINIYTIIMTNTYRMIRFIHITKCEFCIGQKQWHFCMNQLQSNRNHENGENYTIRVLMKTEINKNQFSMISYFFKRFFRFAIDDPMYADWWADLTIYFFFLRRVGDIHNLVTHAYLPYCIVERWYEYGIPQRVQVIDSAHCSMMFWKLMTALSMISKFKISYRCILVYYIGMGFIVGVGIVFYF